MRPPPRAATEPCPPPRAAHYAAHPSHRHRLQTATRPPPRAAIEALPLTRAAHYAAHPSHRHHLQSSTRPQRHAAHYRSNRPEFPRGCSSFSRSRGRLWGASFARSSSCAPGSRARCSSRAPPGRRQCQSRPRPMACPWLFYASTRALRATPCARPDHPAACRRASTVPPHHCDCSSRLEPSFRVIPLWHCCACASPSERRQPQMQRRSDRSCAQVAAPPQCPAGRHPWTARRVLCAPQAATRGLHVWRSAPRGRP